MEPDLSDFEALVLAALVDGYEARQGLKDRIRALNEWEIARRSGFTEISYAGFLDHPTRDQVMGALGTLQRFGLIEVWERGAQYDTFVPTATGTQRVSAARGNYADNDVPSEPVPSQPVLAAAPGPSAPNDQIVERLDEIIRLLRSLESRIGRS